LFRYARNDGKWSAKPVEDRAVHVALERDDELGEQRRLDPLPVAEFGMLGGDVDVAVRADEAREVPVLDLALEPALPKLRRNRVRDVVAQLLGMVGELLDEVRRDPGFLLQLAQRAGPWRLALVHPALRHLPRLVAIIDPPPDPHQPGRIEQHDADSAAIVSIVSHAVSSPVTSRAIGSDCPVLRAKGRDGAGGPHCGDGGGVLGRRG
jgi:hypothetical protein